jgi:hypothetical protein
MNVTLYSDFHTPMEEGNLFTLLERIKSNEFEERVKAIRYAYHQGKHSLGDKLKKELPAFTPSATFKGGRTLEHLTAYSGIAHLDLDDLLPEELPVIIEKVNACSYTAASFISPSYTGLKIFVRVSNSKEDHKEIITQLMQFYHQLTGIEPDPKCKDITRLCFMSWDPNLYVNKESEVFQFVKSETAVPPAVKSISSTSMDECLKFTEKVTRYEKGSRNSFVYLLARNANRFGIGEEEVLNCCLNNFDLHEREITAAVNSAYKHNVAEHAKFAKSAKVAETVSQEAQTDHDLLSTTPIIPDEVYENLPMLLKEGSAAFSENREKDVFLTSALAILSGCLPNVSGSYGQKTVFPNLFTFILAPAASGKGSMVHAKELADYYHNIVKQRSVEAHRDYQAKLRAYKKQHGALSKNADPAVEPPEEPPFKVVFIPANTSSAKLYQHLLHNDDQGIMCETEADTLAAVFKNEWGSYSDLLRKSFHHEKVSLSRKSNNEYIDIAQPRLSVALSGTPSQVFNIISSAEDGLFSRFIFYLFRTDPVWISPAPDPNRPNLTDHFYDLSVRVYRMVSFLSDHPTMVLLSQKQWSELDSTFSEHLDEINELSGGDALSVVKRMGLILYRICMILTAIRKFENGDCSDAIQCEDTDFQTARTLAGIYLQHSLLLYSNLPSQSKDHAIRQPTRKDKLLLELPEKFRRSEAIELGRRLEIKERTVDECLKRWLGTKLQKEDTGWYVKNHHG